MTHTFKPWKFHAYWDESCIRAKCGSEWAKTVTELPRRFWYTRRRNASWEFYRSFCTTEERILCCLYTLDVLNNARLSTVPALLAALYCLACKIQLTVFCGPKRYPAVFCEPKKCDRTAMPVLRHWRRNGMGVLSQFLHYRITNTLLLVHLNVLEAAWILEQCKVEGGLSTVPALLAVLYCLACKI